MRQKKRFIKRTLPVLVWVAAWGLVAVSCGSVEEEAALPAVPAGSAASNTTANPEPAPPPAVEMSKVPAGLFVYGASEEQFQLYLGQTQVGFPGVKEAFRKALVIPARSVSLPDFWMDTFEVSNRQFSQFLAATGYQPASWTNFLKDWNGSQYPDWAADFPVVWVSEADAQAFCHWRGGRLPTDEEWEKADRGPSGKLFPWGDKLPGTETTNAGTGKMEPVGNRPGDRSQYGIYDLAGNVAELTGNQVEIDGQAGYVLRGGSFESSLQHLLAFHRSPGLSAQDRAEDVGFRCVSDRPPQPAP
ncbi:MAG: SUMF1/EgtB/PvdO family nonheme iron enzyme [Acidobacteriota bacterium]